MGGEERRWTITKPVAATGSQWHRIDGPVTDGPVSVMPVGDGGEVTAEMVEKAAWEIHKRYCTLPGVCRIPDEVDRDAARAALGVSQSVQPTERGNE
jgi:hypothetical protein